MRLSLSPLAGVAVALLLTTGAEHASAACCYFSAQNTDILQPAQKVFITWDPEKKIETFTVQPKFEGNALDFGMVIPTPTQPKLHEMPRDFFKNLAIYTILKQRVQPTSKLVPSLTRFGGKGGKGKGTPDEKSGAGDNQPLRPPIVILETGVVGSLDYKIIEASRADVLFKWLKDNKYQYAGDEATLNYYVQKKYVFTVMKIDTMQMKKNKDGSYNGDVTPTRFQFASDKLMYPLKITQISVKDKTEALFYVQAPYKTDLEGDMTYQYTWVPMLQSSSGHISLRQPGGGNSWLQTIQNQIPPLLQRADFLEFRFVRGQRPVPNKQGRTPTTMEWARKLTANDIKVLTGELPYSDVLPDVDEGFTKEDVVFDKEMKKFAPAVSVIRERLKKAREAKPDGYLVRQVPAEDVKALRQLAGHLREGWFITKFRKVFTRGEMNDDLAIVAARLGQHEDRSEYEEILPTSPP